MTIPAALLFNLFALNVDRFGERTVKIYQPDAPSATENPKRPSDACARCRRHAPVRGRFTQTIRGVKRFVCGACCSEIGSVAARIFNAEAAELESQRRRFADRRPADRRAA